MKQKFSETPLPKSISSYFKFKSVNVRNDPMTPQSQLNKNRGALTRKAQPEVDGFAQVSSAVKNSAQNRPKETIREEGLFGMDQPKIVEAGTGKKSVLMDDDEFDAMSFM